MRNLHLYVLTAILAALGLGIFLYNVLVAKIPVVPGQTLESWEVEARVSFTGRGEPAKVALFIPHGTNRFLVADEAYISQGFGVSTTGEGDNRRVLFATRKASGEQSVYYRFVVVRVETRERPPPAPTPDLLAAGWRGAELTAARSLLDEARQKSADVPTQVSALLKELRARAPGGPAALLLGSDPSPAKRADVARRILRLDNVAARAVHGIELAASRRKAPLVHWLEVYAGNQWQAFSLETAAPGIPEDYVPWWRGSQPMVQVDGVTRRGVNVSVSHASEQALRRILLLGRTHGHHGFLSFPLLSLPLELQQVYRILLVVPIGVLVLVLLRNVIGFRTFGTFMPVLIAMAFRETQLVWGVVLFSLVVALGLSVRLYLEHLKLLVVPRLAAVLIVVILTMAGLSVLTNQLGLERGLSVALFPMVILTMTVERMSIIWDERGPAEALKQGLGSMIVAVVCYLVMSYPYTQHLLFVFPELLLVLLALILLLGRYSGYRLLELPRFRALAGRDR